MADDVGMAGPNDEEKNIDPDSDEGLIERVKKHWKMSRDHSNQWRLDAKEWYEYRDGEQWAEEDQQILREQLRPIITFNRIAPIIDAVSGQEVSNRQEVTFYPREQGDIQQNEVLTGAAEWVRDLCDAEDEESDAFLDLVICGMGWTETRMDYEENLEGEVKIERVDGFEMFWDPYAKKRNLSDRGWQIRLKDIPREDFKSFWPGKIDEIDAGIWDHPGAEATGYQSNANEPDEYATSAELEWDNQRNKDSIRVAHYQWWERKNVYRVVMQGQTAEIDQKLFDRIKDRLDLMGVKYLKQTKKVYKQCFIAGKTLLERSDQGPKAYEMKGFTFHCMTGKRRRNKNTWYGMVQAMKDPQLWANKFFSQVQNIMNTNAKGGVMAETGAVDDVRKFERDWARSDSVIWARNGAIAKGKITPKPTIEYPQGIDRLMEFAIRALFEVAGVNLEMLGMTDKVQPGVLEYQRKQSALSILAIYFDALRRYRKEQGRTLLVFIQTHISDGRLVKIMGKEKEQYVPLNRTETATVYDIIVDEAPTSPNQRDKTFAIMQDLLPTMGQMNIPPPPSFLDHSPLPAKVVEEWKELMKPPEVPPEVQEQMQEMEEALEEANEEIEGLKRDQEVKMQKVVLEKEIAAQKQMLAQQELEMERAKEDDKATLQREIEAAKQNLAQDEQRFDQAIAEEKAQHEQSIDERQMRLKRWEARQNIKIKQQQATAAAKVARTRARSNGATR